MTDEPKLNTQTAPYPVVLEELVDACTYRDEWELKLWHLDRGQGCSGLTLSVFVEVPNSYPPHAPIRVHHLFPVPAAAYNRESWRRWLFEQLQLVERHEAMEFFEVDQVKPYAPNHGPGHDPYTVREVTTDEARRTDFRGRVHSN